MTTTRKVALAALAALVPLVPAAAAEPIIANCTGMLNLDIYEIDPDEPSQTVDGIGEAEVSVEADSILLTGAFGEYRFDLKAGTLYHNGSDTSVYCTYKGLPG